MKLKLPALLLLSATLLSACGGGGSSTPPAGNPPPGDTTPGNPPPGNPPPGNPPPGNPPPAAGIDTASFTFKSAGSPTSILAPFVASGENEVGGLYVSPNESGDSSGLAAAVLNRKPGRATGRQMSFLFGKRSAAFKIGERIPLYPFARILIDDDLTFGGGVLYSEEYETGKQESWDSISGSLIVTAVSAKSITLKLENATMSEDIFKENDSDKFIIDGTITYDPTPNN